MLTKDAAPARVSGVFMRRIAVILASAVVAGPLLAAGSAQAQDLTHGQVWIRSRDLTHGQVRIRSQDLSRGQVRSRSQDQHRDRNDVLIAVDKAAQRLTVTVSGRLRHRWPVSTGRDGGPPSGTFRPERLERSWFSRKYDWAPMPHAIFFHKGYAIHGTTHVARLGRRASHGCVRLHPAHAATLFALVRGAGMGRTTIVVSASRAFAARN
jgi:lipoprotein-anchoring transpeptidase ErfK/SrfK